MTNLKTQELPAWYSNKSSKMCSHSSQSLRNFSHAEYKLNNLKIIKYLKISKWRHLWPTIRSRLTAQNYSGTASVLCWGGDLVENCRAFDNFPLRIKMYNLLCLNSFYGHHQTQSGFGSSFDNLTEKSVFTSVISLVLNLSWVIWACNCKIYIFNENLSSVEWQRSYTFVFFLSQI